MRRTRPSLASEIVSSDTAFNIESALFTPPSDDTCCALFGPLHYEPGYGYPLIVWLHGDGEDERQLTRVMPLISMRNYVAVAPRGTHVAADQGGFGWHQSEEAIAQADQRVRGGIAAARRKFHVSAKRVFLAGFGTGGTMAFRLAMRSPSLYAGVLSLCGPFPRDYAPLGQLDDARRLPVLLAAGRDSCEYPPEQVCDDLRLFHTAGLSTSLRQYPCGQELSPQMLADMDRWMIEQISSADVAAGTSDVSGLR